MELILLGFMVLCSQLKWHLVTKFPWLLKEHSCPPPLIFPSLSAPITVTSQIITKLCSFTKNSKTGDVSHLHWMMPDECSFFCSKAGRSAAVSLLLCCGRARRQQCPQEGMVTQCLSQGTCSLLWDALHLSGAHKVSSTGDPGSRLQQICSKLNKKL